MGTHRNHKHLTSSAANLYICLKLPLFSNLNYHIFLFHLRNGIVNMMSNALYKMLSNKTGGGDDVTIATYIMPMPHKLMNITIDITTLIGGVLFPFAFSFLIPVSSKFRLMSVTFS